MMSMSEQNYFEGLYYEVKGEGEPMRILFTRNRRQS